MKRLYMHLIESRIILNYSLDEKIKYGINSKQICKKYQLFFIIYQYHILLRK